MIARSTLESVEVVEELLSVHAAERTPSDLALVRRQITNEHKNLPAPSTAGPGRAESIALARALLFVAAVLLIAAGVVLALFAPRPGGAPTGVHLVAVPVLVLTGAALIDRIRPHH